MPAQFKDEDRESQRKANPEAPRHVEQLGAGSGIGADHFRLKPHAADRAGAGMILSDLGVHRTGPDRALRRINGFDGGLVEMRIRVRNELLAAAGAAKMIVVTSIGRVMRGFFGIDRHAANQVDHQSGGMLAMVTTTTEGTRMNAMFRLGHQPSPSIAAQDGV